jgi:hypothetical protein
MFGQPQSRITPRTQGSGENSKRAVPAREVTNYRSRNQNGSFQSQQRTKSKWTGLSQVIRAPSLKVVVGVEGQ